MSDETTGTPVLPDPESGEPGGGRGRTDEVGGSGVFPASGGPAPADAVVRTPAEWGQGERGAEGYEDSGSGGVYLPRTEPEPPEGPAK